MYIFFGKFQRHKKITWPFWGSDPLMKFSRKVYLHSTIHIV